MVLLNFPFIISFISTKIHINTSLNMKHTNFKTLNPNAHAQNAQQRKQKDCSKSSRDGGMIVDLDSYSEAELKKLKDKFFSDVEKIRGFVKQIEACEFKLAHANSVGKKCTMPMTSSRENKRDKIMEDSTESRKVEAGMMRKCGMILDKLMKHRHGWVFNKPVDVVALRIPDYHEVVKRPMDLGTVKSKLGKCVYGSPLDFAKYVRLTFDNAMLYNRKGEDVYNMATVLLDMFHELFDPAYDKYEVELRGLIVGQGEFCEPVAELTRDYRGEALCDVAPREGAAAEFVSKKQRRVPEVEENLPVRKEISGSEREQLGHALQDLAGEYLDEILQIIAKRNSNLTAPDGDGEIELDITALDSETIWDLDRFVRLHSKA